MDNNLLQTLLQNLQKGKESAQQIRTLLQGSDGPNCDHHKYCSHIKELDDHSLVVLSTLDTALSMLQTTDFNHGSDLITTAKKADHHHCKSEHATSKEKRGCYKRRKIGQSMTTMDTTNVTDDGYAWRKYGQKSILNAHHPRNYYRCTHKIDQGCLATKQLQQISENPTKYRITYHGLHTCNNNPHKNLPILLEQEHSSLYLNFDTNTTTTKHALNNNNPFHFPTVKKEYYGPPIKELEINNMIQSGPSDQYSPSSDLTTTVSDQGEVYSSTTSPHGNGMEAEEDYYSYIMDDDHSLSLDAFLQDLL